MPSDTDITCSGHDEDGDSVDDAIDLCPHIVDRQADRDGDGIGDDCDPEPDDPNQRILIFSTMRSGDVPFALSTPWTQDADAIHFSGAGHAAIDIVGHSYQNVRVAIGADITRVLAPTELHQISLHAANVTAPHDFVELNELNASSVASISWFNGASYGFVASQDLAAPFHTGDVVLQLTAVVGSTMSLDGGWTPAEIYHLEAVSDFGPGSIVHIDVNNLELDLRYVWAVTW